MTLGTVIATITSTSTSMILTTGTRITDRATRSA